MLDAVRPLAQRRRGQHLALLLEGAHAVAVGLRRAADQQHRPAVLLRVRQARETVDDAGTGHDDARARAAGQVADGAGGIGRGLLVAHADIGQADFLRCLGERTHREPDHAEHELHALFLEAFRQQVGAFDLSHVSSCQRAATIGPVTKKSERRSHYAYMAPRQMQAPPVSPSACAQARLPGFEVALRLVAGHRETVPARGRAARHFLLGEFLVERGRQALLPRFHRRCRAG